MTKKFNIMQTIDYKESYKETQKENTENYRKILLNQGMEQLTPQELENMLKELNYKISKSDCDNYYNSYNAGFSYLAKSMYYINIETKRSAFHYEEGISNRNQLEALQLIRKNYFVFDKGRIWDL